MRKKELEQRVKALEEYIIKLEQEKQREKDLLTPPVLGGRK